MKQVFFLFTIMYPFIQMDAQSSEDSVKAAVNMLFEGIKSADTSLVINAFSDSAILQTISQNKEGKLIIRNEAIKDFVAFVHRQKKGAADEKIIFETVKMDGSLAIAWTPYTFYFEGKFSHCGVNSFQIVRIREQWKIQYLIDTRRRSGCNEK